jgi:hypothetical protein
VIYAPKDHITFSQEFRLCLPSFGYGDYVRIRIDRANKALGYIYLERHVPNVCGCCSDQPIEIALFHDIRVGNDKRSDADVRQLLSDMRSTTAKSNDGDPAVAEDCLAALT